MAAPWRYRVTVDSLALDRLFLPGGDVWSWSRDVARETVGEAILTAPKRTGSLAGQHGFNQTPHGKRGVRWTVFNDSPYAKFVHEGTTGPIKSNRPGGLLLVAAGNGFPTFTAKSVDGQDSNPWMERANQLVLARHGIR
jgi:hypothetical protein